MPGFSPNAFRIDDLLDGGIFTGEITELTGTPSSGKTQLCFMASLAAATFTEASVLYIDTLNSFSPTRLAEIYRSNPVFSKQGNLEGTLSKIRCVHIYDIFQMIEFLETLQRDLAQEGSVNGLTKMIIIDSVASVVSPVLAGGGLYLGSLSYFLSKKVMFTVVGLFQAAFCCCP